jgi:putative ABC transport system substrate-binding protein
MKRRAVLALFASLPFAAQAQKRAQMRIGYIVTASSEEQEHLTKALRDGLSELGYIAGRDYLFEPRYAGGRLDRLDGLAKELVGLNVDVIVTGGNPVIAAVMRETTSIPIVMTTSRDPILSGFVASLSRPGGNITGLTSDPVPEIFTKNVALIKELVPTASRAALLLNPQSPGANAYQKLASQTAQEIGLALQPFEARARAEFEQVFKAIAGAGTEAVVVLPDPLFFTARREVTALAAKYNLPAVYHAREFVEAGGLISYGASLTHQFRRASVYVDKILKGARASDLPVEAPTRFELVLNRKSANALGITLAATLLARADEVIE